MKRTRKILIGLGTSLLVLFGILYVAILYIQSSYLKDKILPMVLSEVEAKSNAKISIEDIDLSLWKGVVLRKIRIQKTTDAMKATATLEQLSIRYSFFSIFSDQVKLNSISLEGLHLDLDLSLTEGPPEDQTKITSAPPLQMLTQSLEALPVGVEITSIDLQQISGKISVKKGDLRSTAHLKNIIVSGDGAAGKTRAFMNFILHIPETHQSLEIQLDPKKAPITMEPSLNLVVFADITKTKGQWIPELKVFKAQSKIDQLQIPEFSSQTLSVASTAELKMIESLGSLDLTLKLPPEIQIKENSLKIGDEFKAQIKFDLNSENNALRLKLDVEKSIPQIEFDKIKLAASRASGRGQVVVGEKLQLDLQGEWSSPSLVTGFETMSPFSLFQDGIRFQFDTQVNLGTAAEIRTLRVSNANEALKFEVGGRFTQDLKTISLRGSNHLKGSSQTSAAKGAAVSGDIQIPWQFQRTGGGRVSFSSTFKAKDFSASTKDFSLTSWNAEIPVELELSWVEGSLPRLTTLITRNPFERVDYEGIRPYVQKGRPPFSLKKFKAGEFEVGPLIADVSLRQNLLTAENYQLDLFDGRMMGRLFIDFWPGRHRLGFLGRVSNLDPRQIKGKKQAASLKRISSRVAMIYDLEKSLAEGRLDITEIGGEQMNALIEIVDPEFKDDQMNLARSLLKFAHPEYVGIKMAQGFLDLNLDMGGLISVSNLGIEGVPLSPVLASMKQDALQKLQKGQRP